MSLSGVELRNLKRYYEQKTGQSPDTYDWDSIDSTLDYGEVLEQLQEELGTGRSRAQSERAFDETDSKFRFLEYEAEEKAREWRRAAQREARRISGWFKDPLRHSIAARKGHIRRGQSLINKAGRYRVAGVSHQQNLFKDAKIKAVHIHPEFSGRNANRGDSEYSKKYGGWI